MNGVFPSGFNTSSFFCLVSGDDLTDTNYKPHTEKIVQDFPQEQH